LAEPGCVGQSKGIDSHGEIQELKIAITTVQVPFISGGAEALAEGLSSALRLAGHQVELVTMPFRFSPPSAVMESMQSWRMQDFERFDCGRIDCVISLKFPTYYLSHERKIVWLLHQHRSVYELYDTPYGESSLSTDAKMLRDKVIEIDTQALGGASAVYTIANTVSKRLYDFNGIHSTPLYHPPPHADCYQPGPAFPYIYVPSRLEALKRVDLLIQAMKFVARPLYAVIAGEGGQETFLRRAVEQEGLQKRVRFIGKVDAKTHQRYYSNAFLVYFGPYAEDLGYVTLEAMLSAKPVITCVDSGGPTEFVVDGETGRIVEPDANAVADAINDLWANKTRASDIGINGLNRYRALNISWSNIVETLLRK
jgi:glycosyltransferase involved in cell wall biosynthesis